MLTSSLATSATPPGRELLDKTRDGLWVSAYQRPLAEVAIAEAERNDGKTSELLEKAQGLLPSAVDPGHAKAAADRIKELCNSWGTTLR